MIVDYAEATLDQLLAVILKHIKDQLSNV
jgi:hypothetical protein